jgi:hypothetical protein
MSPAGDAPTFFDDPARPEESPMSTIAERTAVPRAVTTPSSNETPMGVLEFDDGYPTAETAAKVRDHLDYLHGVEAFMNSIQGVSTYALREGFIQAGVMDGDVLICSELMDSRSLVLTANADTVYFCAFFDLSRGPLVLETPEDTLESSTTCGSAGSPTSGCRAPTAARVAAICWSVPATTGPCPKGATTFGTRAPTTW